MVIHKVDISVVLDLQIIRGIGYMSYKPLFIESVFPLIPDWVLASCAEETKDFKDCTTFISSPLELKRSDLIDLLNSQESFTVHDV